MKCSLSWSITTRLQDGGVRLIPTLRERIVVLARGFGNSPRGGQSRHPVAGSRLPLSGEGKAIEGGNQTLDRLERHLSERRRGAPPRHPTGDPAARPARPR